MMPSFAIITQSSHHLISSVLPVLTDIKKRGYMLELMSSFSVYVFVLTLIYSFFFLCYNEMHQHFDLILTLLFLRNIDLQHLFCFKNLLLI